MPLVGHLVRSHWKALTLALVAVLGETLADVLEPWPIKIVVDNILQAKKLPPRVDGDRRAVSATTPTRRSTSPSPRCC